MQEQSDSNVTIIKKSDDAHPFPVNSEVDTYSIPVGSIGTGLDITSGTLAATIRSMATSLGQGNNVVLSVVDGEFATIGVVLGTVTDINSGVSATQAIITNSAAGAAAILAGDLSAAGAGIIIGGVILSPAWTAFLSGLVAIAAGVLAYSAMKDWATYLGKMLGLFDRTLAELNPDPSPEKLFGKVPLGIRGAQGAFDGALGAFSLSDPLILDLNGDGVLTTALSASISLFDIDGDGFAERTGWASANDGMLAIDTNGNGTIDNVSELFGDDTAANGIAKLKNYDLNGDNVIDANDAVYAQLKIWQDVNQNGITDNGELKSLAEWNIVSIGLTATNGQISFSYADGTQGVAEDKAFSVDQVQSYYTGEVTLDADVFALPWLRGYGIVKDLPAAMSENDDLKACVADIATATDLVTLNGKIGFFDAQRGIDPAPGETVALP